MKGQVEVSVVVLVGMEDQVVLDSWWRQIPYFPCNIWLCTTVQVDVADRAGGGFGFGVEAHEEDDELLSSSKPENLSRALLLWCSCLYSSPGHSLVLFLAVCRHLR